VYCLRCGHSLVERLLLTEDRPRLVCAACGYIHYVNPKIVCGTLPVWDGQVWLLRRAIEPRLGYWSHPAGYLELGESTTTGALRETQEEIGWAVRIVRLLGVYSRAEAPVVNVVYLAAPRDPAILPYAGKESLEVAPFAPEAIPWGELAFTSTIQALRDWVAALATSADHLH
jgi:ADP-ribose pyrophosphatase YjhB (NUDIX family)